MIRILPILLFVLLSNIAYSQSKISGRVTYVHTGEPVEFANVIVQNVDMDRVFAYAMTDTDGRYAFEGKFSADSLAIMVTAVNIAQTTKIIENKSRILDFQVRENVLEINEIVVKATIPAVKREGDTLTYRVNSCRDSNDLVAEDIIRKLPGVEVQESGKISYQGKEISKFYIEGLDMLGDSYTVASKNIRVDDIRSIDIYENHQHVKALKRISRPDAAAMNITLNDEAKGTWIGSAVAGVGYKPWMWRGEVSAMYFGKKMQSIDTYKTNNMGDDVSREFGLPDRAASIIGVSLPAVPPLDENLYMDNDIHAISSNFLFKLTESALMKMKVSYAHDLRKSEGESTTVYNIIGEAPITVSEVTEASERSDIVNLSLNIEDNKEKSYLDNTLCFNGDFNKDYSRVLSDGIPVRQSFELPALSIRNNLRIIIPMTGKLSLNLRSNTMYLRQPTSLRVTPMLFPEIFGMKQVDHAVQTLHSSQFATRNSLFGAYNKGRWNISLGIGVNAHIENMTSELHTEALPAADSMRNDINWRRYDMTIGPSISYKINDVFFISAYVNADLMLLQTKDRICGKNNEITKFIVLPSLHLNGKISRDLNYSASAEYVDNYGGLYDSYGGFIMTDYRNIATKDGKLRNTKNQHYTASMGYSNALDLLFANVKTSYWRANSNLTYAYSYDGALTYIESVNIPNLSHGLTLEAKVSKQILSIGTIFNIGGGWNRTWSEIIRQDERLNALNDFYTASFGVNTKFSKWLNLAYRVTCNRSENVVEAIEEIAPINYIKQEGELLFSFDKNFILSVDAEHYYNGTLAPEYRNMVFLGAKLTYKAKRFSYTLDARNLLNIRSFGSVVASDITDYRYSFALRPMGIIVTIRYDF